jgi:pimeloyl-ACP methyl ester carboxylesterase
MIVSERIGVLKQTVRANGTELYCEQRGSGPPVLFIAGATGDAGHFEGVAAQLADQFTVVTYDRRGNSRSPAPDGWTNTSIEEQADDAAGLITTLGLKPVGVFVTSGGGAIGLELVRRHPDLVVGAVLHEPFLPHVLGDQWAQIDAHNRATFCPILAARGPRAPMEAILRAMRGDAGFEALDEALRERMLGNAEAFLLEDAPYPRYWPDDAALSAIRHPVHVLLGEAGAPWAPQMAVWLARRLGTEVACVPGGHGAYLDESERLAAALRPHLRAITRVFDHVPADESADPCNYAAYDFALEQPEYARWLQEGPT